MKYLTLSFLILCLCLIACGTEGDCQNASNTNGSETSETAETNSDASNQAGETGNETDNDSQRPGTSATSCGDRDFGLEPVDCTMHGDTDAYCIYGNHCHCNTDAGFQCEEPFMDDWAECAPGSTCIPIEAS